MKKLFLLPLLLVSVCSCSNNNSWTELKEGETLTILVENDKYYHVYSNDSNRKVKYQTFTDGIFTIDVVVNYSNNYTIKDHYCGTTVSYIHEGINTNK